MINFNPIIRLAGALLALIGVMMWTGVPFSLYFKSGDASALFFSGLIGVVLGGLLFWWKKGADKSIGKREGYLIVALGWLTMVTYGMTPYLMSGEIPSVTDAFFETVSGMTTTGASILNDIEAVPEGILFWRSLTQWIGGMGIIVLTVAIFPLLGFGGVELFVAEAPGPTSDKIHPRIQETAKILWMLYVGLTGLLHIIYWIAGMTFYEAINHALTTMATGGFSTMNASMAAYSPLIQYIAILFMFIAGTNYTIIYYGVNGKFKKVWSSDEFKAYTAMFIGFSLLTTAVIYFNTNTPFEQSFRDATFQVISLVTTTGFISADYTSWHPAITILMFILLFLGGSAGSTSGGIKVIRHLVFFKNSLLEFKRLLHPKAMIRMKIDKTVVEQRIITHILVFLLIYLMIFIMGSMVMSIILPNTDQNFLTAIGSVATAIGNVGPGIGNVGPTDNFAAIPDAGKWFLSFLMLLGRLELFTILILFSPYFWRTN